MPKPTITKVLDRMSEAGLIRVAHDPKDRRVRRTYLTKKGRSLKGDAGVRWYAVEEQLLKKPPGIPPKVLATRPKELEAEGFIQKHAEKSNPPKVIRWSLAKKGLDALRIRMMIDRFGAKWHVDKVFDDRRPRTLGEL